MYHCHVHFYFVGCPCRTFERIREMPPLTAFTHTFQQSDQPEQALCAQADVVFANLEDADAAAVVSALVSAMREDARLILLASPGQPDLLSGFLPSVQDIWMLPMSDEETKFRFLRWQQACQQWASAHENQHFLEALSDSSPNLIWFKDKDGVHERVNKSFCHVVSKTREQVQGRRHAYIWDVEEDDPACIESERIVMERRETVVSEESVQTPEGIRLLTTYKSPLYDLDGSVMGTVGLATDITRERAYEQEIVRKSRTLEAIFRTMDCGILSHSLDGRHVIGVNRAALEILGYSSLEELEADDFQMIAATVEKGDQERLRKAIQSLEKPGDTVSVEYRVRHKDGKRLHVMGSIKLVEENGERFYQRFLLDCTKQKLEKEREERRQMQLVHALGIDYSLICYFDLESGVGRAFRISGCITDFLQTVFEGKLVLEECMGTYISHCVYSEDRETMMQLASREFLKKELSEKDVYFCNYRTACEGVMKYFQAKVVRAGGWDDRDYSVVIGIRSVDEEIRSEMEKQNQLEDALMQANRASKAKSVFLSNMSHDIRTPMNAIVGFTALALTHIEQTEQVEDYLKKIMTSGNHLLSLLNDILDMSRIESGRMHLEEAPCSLPELLHSLRSIVQADVHARQLELYMDTVDVWDEDIYCDRLRLNQVLLNLLGNSVKYTSAGGIVSMRVIEKPSAQEGFALYEFHIKDNGIGMSEEFLAHIFEPFERERNSTISGIQGTGLGMAITKNIVDMMNGTISVESEQGVGTEFVVSFTFRLHSGRRETPVIPQLKNCRALVVDDDFNTCDSVSYMLSQLGMRAEWTLSGREAVLRTRQAASRQDHYMVYLIDWLLPDMNGVEVARRIRKEVGDEAPIIVLTAYDWTDIEAEAREAGVTAFCSKPLFFSELQRCLCSVVGTEEAEIEVHPPRRRHTGRILLAEDNALNQEIAVAILSEAGFSVEIAGTGRAALQMLAASTPGYYQLILMDVQMPEMDGYQATKAIRAMNNPQLSSIPILAMTANAFEEDRRQALQSGMNGHIAKPIDIEALFDTLDTVLS